VSTVRVRINSELAVRDKAFVWWATGTVAPPCAMAALDLGDQLTVTSGSPAVWRALAAAFLATADALETEWRAHSAEPPAVVS
jgi:hypothetical protein